MPIRRTSRLSQKKFLSENRNLSILDLGCSYANFWTEANHFADIDDFEDGFRKKNLKYTKLEPGKKLPFKDKEFDYVELVYNKFKNAATQIVTNEQFLPIEKHESKEDQTNSLDYIFEPSKIKIISELIPKSLKTQLYKSVRDSYASEHGARMTAMHKATDNATELRDQLKLTYNKARQAAITNEILEIVGGAEALNG